MQPRTLGGGINEKGGQGKGEQGTGGGKGGQRRGKERSGGGGASPPGPLNYGMMNHSIMFVQNVLERFIVP